MASECTRKDIYRNLSKPLTLGVATKVGKCSSWVMTVSNAIILIYIV